MDALVVRAQLQQRKLDRLRKQKARLLGEEVVDARSQNPWLKATQTKAKNGAGNNSAPANLGTPRARPANQEEKIV